MAYCKVKHQKESEKRYSTSHYVSFTTHFSANRYFVKNRQLEQICKSFSKHKATTCNNLKLRFHQCEKMKLATKESNQTCRKLNYHRHYEDREPFHSNRVSLKEMIWRYDAALMRPKRGTLAIVFQLRENDERGCLKPLNKHQQTVDNARDI